MLGLLPGRLCFWNKELGSVGPGGRLQSPGAGKSLATDTR